MLTLEAKVLSYRRRRRIVLDDLSLDFSHGHIAMLGPNGAGKTTLFNLLSGCLPIQRGDVLVGGTSIRTAEGRQLLRSIVGYQFQDARMSTMRVRDAVAYAAWLKRVPANLLRSRVNEVLTKTNLIELADRGASKISGGERKRVAIAQALVGSPQILFLDEPTASLDPQERADVLTVLRSLREETRVVLSTHDTRDVADICDRVVVLHRGRVAFDGSAGEFAPSTDPNRFDASYQAIVARETEK